MVRQAVLIDYSGNMYIDKVFDRNNRPHKVLERRMTQKIAVSRTC